MPCAISAFVRITVPQPSHTMTAASIRPNSMPVLMISEMPKERKSLMVEHTVFCTHAEIVDPELDILLNRLFIESFDSSEFVEDRAIA